MVVPSGVRVLHRTVLGAALLAVLIGVLLPGAAPAGSPLTAPGGVAAAVAVVAAAQLARLRFRIGRGPISMSWGEAAFIVGYAVAPPGWVPFATLAGGTLAWLVLTRAGERRPRADVVHLVASLTVGAAGATLVTRAVAGPAALGSGRMQAALAAGALTYLLLTLTLAVLTLTLNRYAAAGQSLGSALHAKLPMLAGSVLIGQFGVLALVREPLWLLVFPPALWLLQRTYRYHLRAEEERRTWAAFAGATAALPGERESDVADAGLRGALDVFAAHRVEIEILAAGGGLRRYAGDAPGAGPDVSGLSGSVITRSMAVAGTPIGELTVWLSERAAPMTRADLAVSAYGDALAGALHDAAAHERLAKLEARVRNDQVTGLMNRAQLLARGERARAEIPPDRPVALLLLDLDKFREVNGTLGHRAGDAVLALVAERLTDLAREGELVARLGDDEFAVFLPAVLTLADSASPLQDRPGPLPQAVRRAREVADNLAVPFTVEGVRLAVEGSVGVVVSPAGRADMAELVRRATIALDQAKEQQLGVATYDSDRDASSTDHLAMLAELQDALHSGDQIELALQPAVDLETGAPTGVEALTRWKHPRRGRLSPNEFIRTIESSELLAPFTRHVLDLSLAAAADWAGHGLDLPVSVNVSARSLLDPTFPQQIADVLRRHQLTAAHLVLEITESVAVSAEDIVDEVLTELRAMGVQLSVDDFGTGYSSLSFITRVSIDELKVDRSFVAEMIDLPAAAAVVRGAVELGDRLGARVVAEGVETAEQRAALLALGCTSAQGYHFCRPLPADKIVDALRRLAETAPAKVVPLRADDAS